LIFSGCSSKQYFEPEQTFSADGAASSYGGTIIDQSRDGATLKSGRYIGKAGISNINLGENYRFLSQSSTYVLAGSVDGKHYTDSVERVKQLKRDGKNSEAIAILLESVNATEAESTFAGEGWGVAPWYYEQLAILYRKEKQYRSEVEILKRYENQPKAPGVGPEKLAARLIKAQELLAKDGK
jgi:hypothetical protein